MSRDYTEVLRRLATFSGKGAEATVEGCRQMLVEDPRCAPALMALGLIAYGHGDQGLGIEFIEQAHQIDPDCHEFADLLANIYARVGRIADSVYYAKLSTALPPNPDLAGFVPGVLKNYREALEHTAVSLHALYADCALRIGKYEEAIQHGEQELRINRHHVEAMAIVARAMVATGRAQAGLSYLHAAAHLQPDWAWLHAWLADACLACGRHTEALAHLKLASSLDPADKELAAHLAGASEWLDEAGWIAAAPLREAFARCVIEAKPRKVRQAPIVPPIIGVMSDQIHDGPLKDCILPVLRSLERVVLYRLNQRSDAGTEAFRLGCMRFRDAVGIDNATLSRTLANEALGFVLNLCAPNEESRFPRMEAAEGALPMVQWLSLPLVDRLPGADLVISGPETADLDRETFGQDKMVVLDRLVAYAFPRVPADDEMVRSLPRSERGFATFGVWGDLRCFSQDAIALWSQVLWQVPDSMLLIGGRHGWERDAIEQIGLAFAGYGVAHRVRFQETGEGLSAANEFYHQIDILLDSTPVSGGFELARALWMGVPVVTLRGARRAGRMGASILQAAGHDSWIAAVPADYLALAKALAQDPELDGIRVGLRQTVEASPLADPEGLAKALLHGLCEKLGLPLPADEEKAPSVR